MRLRPYYTLPELLALLSIPQSRRGLSRWGRQQAPRAILLQHLIRLARQGLREYSRRLDRLAEQVESRPWERDGHRSDPDDFSREPREDEAIEASCSYPEDADDNEVEPQCLSRTEIHLLLATLATRRARLNARGYPYTSDVNEERERIYPESDELEGEEVRDAWDDWGNEGGKRLFRRHHADVDRERGRRNETRRRRHRREDEDDDPDDDRDEDFDATAKDLPLECPPEADPEEVIYDTPGEHVFEVFDEFVLGEQQLRCDLAVGQLPDFEQVNLRLQKRGVSEFQHEGAFRRAWAAYLVASISARVAPSRAGRPEAESDNEPVTDEVARASVVEIKAEGREGQVIIAAGKGKKWRPA